MFDLMTAAFQTDSTRVITFQMAIEQSNRAYREIGIADSHHGLTHHGGDTEKIEKCIKINRTMRRAVRLFHRQAEGDSRMVMVRCSITSW